MSEPIRITTLDNGPFLVKGEVNLTDAEGISFQAEGETIALCRCGISTTKPFCNGAHTKTDFKAAERAVQPQR